MGGGIPFSVQTVLLFLAILFVAICCGFIRGVSRHFSRKTINQREVQRRRILQHIVIPIDTTQRQTTSGVNNNNNNSENSVYPTNDSLSPPSYPVTPVTPPPTYEDVMKFPVINTNNSNNTITTRF